MELTRQQIWMRLMVGAIWGSLSVAQTANAETAGTPKTQYVLQGLQTVVVLSEDLQPETLETGISREWLRALLYQRLHQAGIRTLTAEEARHAPGFTAAQYPSALGIFVDADRDPQTGLYTGFYRLVLMDNARLVRRGEKAIPVTTWFREGMIRPTTRRGFKRAVEEIASDSLHEFVRLYRTANARTLATHH